MSFHFATIANLNGSLASLDSTLKSMDDFAW